jgi:hypothetical protein
MDPQSAAHLIRLLRNIAIELRLANDIALMQTPYPSTGLKGVDTVKRLRDEYREEMA